MARKPKKKPTEAPCRYAVAWIDMLGQRDILKRIKDSPQSPAEAAQTNKTLHRSVRSVKEFRKRIRGYYHAHSYVPLLPDWLPDTSWSRLTELRRRRVTLRGVSDAMALWVPLSDDAAVGLWG